MTQPVRALLAELERYKPADETEARHHRAIKAHLVHAKSPFSRTKLNPGHITASVFIVDPASKRILLHHHRRLARWLQMGGHVESGETPADAALREGEEESGLADLKLAASGIFDLDVHPIPARGEEREHFHYDIRYVATTRAPDSIALNEGESSELAWNSIGPSS
jgi:8-oxo-dGTP pyrophosphatase MutT (NUDIX family)